MNLNNLIEKMKPSIRKQLKDYKKKHKLSWREFGEIADYMWTYLCNIAQGKIDIKIEFIENMEQKGIIDTNVNKFI